MEPSRFDDLTKALATSTSRRQALKTIAAATVGSILGLGRLSTAFGAPKCHRNGLGCDTNSQCCSGYCQNGEKCTCPPAPACTTPPNNTCPCPSGQTCCSGTCTDLSSDNNNCGSCGNKCDACSTCQSGTCVSSCASGQVCLNGSCCAICGGATCCGPTCTCCGPNCCIC